MRVPAVITDEVFALVGDVLGDFGQEIEGTEDLEIAARSASQVGTGRSREAVAVVLFGRYSTDPSPVRRTTRARLNGQRRMYWAKRCKPSVSRGDR
jgi:hypothetical protein